MSDFRAMSQRHVLRLTEGWGGGGGRRGEREGEGRRVTMGMESRGAEAGVEELGSPKLRPLRSHGSPWAAVKGINDLKIIHIRMTPAFQW